MAELTASVSHTSQRILAAVTVFGQTAVLRAQQQQQQQQGDGGGAAAVGGVAGGEEFRRERLELAGLEEGYNRCCTSTFKDLQ